MLIKDPQNLLSVTIPEDWKIPDKILEIPPHGISLHPHSIEKLLIRNQDTNIIFAFQPHLPITSELVSLDYPILAYLYPQELIENWQQIKPQLDTLIQRKIFGIIPYVIISDLDNEEQKHYFSKYYGKVSNPSYVRVIVNNICNLKCVMCPYHSSLFKPNHTTDFFQNKKEMSWQMMQKLAKECGQAGITILIGSVEEPLLHPKLFDFIELCREQGVPKVHLTTNGQLLNKNYAEKLLKAGLTSIDISIDAADPDTYLAIRGANLSRVESNVINFLEIRDKLNVSCEVRVSFVRNQEVTKEEEQKFLNNWIPKVNSVFILNVAEYQEKNMKLAKTNQAVESSLQYYQTQAQGRWPCFFPFIEMAVLPDGRIYYCIETLFRLGFDKEIESLGDYNKQTLQEIWSGDLFQKLRQDLILNQLQERTACKDCNMWKSQVVHREISNEYRILTTTVTEIYSQIH